MLSPVSEALRKLLGSFVIAKFPLRRRSKFAQHQVNVAEVEHRDGKITLHDVTMVLYGRKGDRADRTRASPGRARSAVMGHARAVGLRGVGVDDRRPPVDPGSDRPEGPALESHQECVAVRYGHARRPVHKL